LVGVAGTRYTGFGAITRVDRDAHRATSADLAVVPRLRVVDRRGLDREVDAARRAVVLRALRTSIGRRTERGSAGADGRRRPLGAPGQEQQSEEDFS